MKALHDTFDIDECGPTHILIMWLEIKSVHHLLATILV